MYKQKICQKTLLKYSKSTHEYFVSKEKEFKQIFHFYVRILFFANYTVHWSGLHHNISTSREQYSTRKYFKCQCQFAQFYCNVWILFANVSDSARVIGTSYNSYPRCQGGQAQEEKFSTLMTTLVSPAPGCGCTQYTALYIWSRWDQYVGHGIMSPACIVCACAVLRSSLDLIFVAWLWLNLNTLYLCALTLKISLFC